MSSSPMALRGGSMWVLAALMLGVVSGAMASGLGDGLREPMVRIASTIGGLWLDGLKMTVVPLIIALLITGIAGGTDAARSGGIAGRSIATFAIVLTASAIVGAIMMPLLLDAFPLSQESADSLRAGLSAVDTSSAASSVPRLEDFLRSALPSNPIAAAADDKILSLVVFVALFAFAVSRIDPENRQRIFGFFQAIEKAMLVMVGWVLKLAVFGVFGLAFSVGAGAGGAVFAALGHYIALVASVGLVVMIGGYLLARFGAGWSITSFARAMIAPQAVAISTQSSLASLPAMLNSARALGVPERNSDIGLPLAVALFRATGPAMNVSVAIYVAYWLDMPLSLEAMIAGVAVASVASYWAVSLPGALSFVTSIAPIALAMGVPIEPLALLIGVEVLPDIMRTLGNVVMDVAVTGTVAKRTPVREATAPETV